MRVHPGAGLALLLLLLAGCTESAAPDASDAYVSDPRCLELIAHEGISEAEGARYDSPAQAAAAYHSVHGLDFAVPASGYVVTTSGDGQTAELVAGDIELFAVNDVGVGWRIVVVRACGNYQPSNLPAAPTYTG